MREIIDECPKPNLPYGKKVVELAATALHDIGVSTSLPKDN